MPIENLTFTKTGEKIETIERLNELVNQRMQDYANERIEALKKEFIRLTENCIYTSKGRLKGTYKLSEADRQQICLLHEQGVSKRKIADMYEVSEKTIRNYLKLQ